MQLIYYCTVQPVCPTLLILLGTILFMIRVSNIHENDVDLNDVLLFIVRYQHSVTFAAVHHLRRHHSKHYWVISGACRLSPVIAVSSCQAYQRYATYNRLTTYIVLPQCYRHTNILARTFDWQKYTIQQWPAGHKGVLLCVLRGNAAALYLWYGWYVCASGTHTQLAPTSTTESPTRLTLHNLQEINNVILCCLNTTATQTYWQELSADKNILFGNDLQVTKVSFYV